MATGQEVKVDVEHGLAGPRPVVDYHAVAFRVKALVFRYFSRGEKKVPDELSVILRHAVDVGNMFFGDDQGVDGSLRVHVLESGHEAVLVHDF